MTMAKWKAGDIIVGHKSGQWQNNPHVVLGEHVFPDGKLAYRIRECLPQYDMLDDTEHWSNRDHYGLQEFLDDFKLIWRRKSG